VSTHHHVDCLHLYAEHLAAAGELPAVIDPGPAMTPLNLPWASLDAVLQQTIAGEQPAHPGWAELSQVMGSYRVWKSGNRDQARVLAARMAGPLARRLEAWYDHLEPRVRSAPIESRA
jgi:thymidylate synthase